MLNWEKNFFKKLARRAFYLQLLYMLNSYMNQYQFLLFLPWLKELYLMLMLLYSLAWQLLLWPLLSSHSDAYFQLFVQVIDGLDTQSTASFGESIMRIRQSISGSPQTVVFSDCSSDSSVKVFQNFLHESFCRIPLEDFNLPQMKISF